MPKRPDSLADRLRTAWRRPTDELVAATTGPDRGVRGRSRGSDFADRLRAAVGTRR